MFEQEAEEIAKDIYIHRFDDDVNYPEVLKAITVGVQKGAEFGCNKANEWHYVEGGDLPPDDTEVLSLMTNKEICIAHFYRKNVWDKIGTIIAWKVIVPPEVK